MYSDGKALLSVCLLLWAGHASGFRNCETEDSYAWTAATRYLVGELDFDDVTGEASGTETIYNYSNAYPGAVGECHVTYELSGSYVAGVEVFTLSATRTNYSDTCPAELLRVEFPATLQHDFQVTYDALGSAVVNNADSGEVLAQAAWQPGRATYKTGEHCTIF